MKKLIITAGAVILFATPSLAEGSFDGFYAGVDGVYGHAKAEGQKDNSFSSRINAGYGTTHNKIYFGGEGNLDFRGFDMTVDGQSFKKDLGYGVTGRVGYEFSPTYLGYGLVGYEHADVKIGGHKEGFNGIRYGGGVETKLQRNISARSEISYSRLKHDGVAIKDLRTTVGLAVRF